MYDCTLSLTSASCGGGWSKPLPGRFTVGKDSVPLVQEAGWSVRPVWTGVRKMPPPPGFYPRTVHLVACRYTDCAIPTQLSTRVRKEIQFLKRCITFLNR
jgi:hypothetical protein